MSQLPQGWRESLLGEVVDYGKTKKVEASDIPAEAWLLELEDIEKHSSRLLQKVRFKDRDAKSTKNVFKAGDVLYGKLRPYLNKVIVADEDGYCSTEIIPISPTNELNAKFLFYSLKRQEFLDYVQQVSHGIRMPRLGTKQGKQAPFIQVPIEEQKRIADKLDSVLAKVEAAQARLDKIPTILKRFRQSVLAAATSGELTKDWREEHNVDIDDWRQSKLSDVSKCLDPNPSHRYPKADSSGVPILSTQQFVGLDSWTKDKAKLVNREFFLERKEKTKFLEDDIIFARKGRLGLARMAPKGFDYVYSHTVFIVRASGVNTDYLLWLLRQDQTVNWLLKEMNSNTGVPTLGKSIFEKLPVPLPSEEEQVAIVNKVKELFEHANTVEKQYNAAKARLDKLTQSILAKAFRGDLVINNSGEELKVEAIAEFIEPNNKVRSKTNLVTNEKAKEKSKPKKKLTVPRVHKNNSLVYFESDEPKLWRDTMEIRAIEKAEKNMANTDFSLQQFRSVTEYNANDNAFSEFVLRLLKGVPGKLEPLLEVTKWDKRTGEYLYRLKK